MTRAEILFDRTPGSTPFDRAGVLTAWSVPDTAPDGAPEPVQGHRWPGRRWTGLQGYSVEDPDSVFHGSDGLTARFLMTPDWTVLDQAVWLLHRGQMGPANGQVWAWAFYAIDRADRLELGYLYQREAAGPAEWRFLGSTGRKPESEPYLLGFVIDGELVQGFADGRLVGERDIPRPVFTSDVQLHLGHRYRHDEPSSSDPFRGVLEYVEIEDCAATPLQEAHRHDALVGAPARITESVGKLFYQNPIYLRRRMRPIADLFAAIEERASRLTAGHSPPAAYGAILRDWERALGLQPGPRATVAQRQQDAYDAAQAPLGHSVGEVAAYARGLFGLATDDSADDTGLEILENSNWTRPRTEGTGRYPADWIHRGVVLAQPMGLSVIAQAGVPNLPSSYPRAYLAVHQDVASGHDGVQFACRVTELRNRSPRAMGAIELASAATMHRLTLVERGPRWVVAADGDELALIDRGPFDVRIECQGRTCTVRLLRDRAELVVATFDMDVLERIGVALVGTGPAPSLDARMRITGVHLLQPDSGVSYHVAAYHPEPKNQQTAFHSALLTEHGRASVTITATHARALRCDDSDSRLDTTPLDNPANP